MTTAPEYAKMTLDEIAGLPAGTILLRVFSRYDEDASAFPDRMSDPDIYRRAWCDKDRWQVLSDTPDQYDWDWADSERVHAESAWFAVIHSVHS